MRVLTPTSSKRLNEVTGFVFLGAGILLLLSLVSYHAQDPSWDTASGPTRSLNLVGPFGAHLADLLLQGFGAAAFLFPVLAFVIGWKWIRSDAVETPLVRLVGFVVFLGCSTAAISLLHNISIYDHLIPIGGTAGEILADKLLENFNLWGAAVMAGLGMIVSVYLFSAFTLEKMNHWFAPLGALFAHLRQSWREWLDRRRERGLQREEARQAARERQEAAREAAMQRIAERTQTPDFPAPTPLSGTSEKRGRKKKSDAQGELDLPVTTTVDELPWQTTEERAAAEESGEIPICILEEQPPQPPARGVMTLPTPAEPVRKMPEPARPQTIYKLPPTEFLNEASARTAFDEQELKSTAAAIKAKFEEFSVMGSVVQINPGPVVTTFEFKPDAGVKYTRITALREDLCLGLQAESILIERIPGKMTVGVEVPNTRREVIALRQILESEEFQNSSSRLTISMGKDINGRIKVATLDTMPHALIAGSTGSGKSVMINSLVMSILYKATPDEVRMIMVDPKRVELGMYEGIPHLLTPVITDPRKATNALKNAVLEMERRLRLLAEHGARNIEQFNKKVRKLQEQPRSLFEDAESETAAAELRPLPFILILIDELADLMMLEGKNVEESVTRLAQMARAVGMHLVLATQRPSVDVITGLIKANFPARISFRVATRVDSRTILDVMGAEHLLGKGDMLFLPPGSSRLTRVHGAFVTESEINSVVDFWKQQAQPEYDQSYLIAPPADDMEPSDVEPDSGEQDPMYEDALRVVLEMGKASTSTLQRRLRLGYGRAARILDMMYKDGIIGPPDGSKPREVLKRPDWVKEVNLT